MSDIAPIDQALLPKAVREGTAERKQNYQAALSFERVLVGQMTEAMTKGLGAMTGDDEDGGSAATAQLKQQMPGTLADALMAGGGIGLAAQMDQLWNTGTNKPSATSLSGDSATADAAPADATGSTGGSAV